VPRPCRAGGCLLRRLRFPRAWIRSSRGWLLLRRVLTGMRTPLVIAHAANQSACSPVITLDGYMIRSPYCLVLVQLPLLQTVP
jgi:hypothetical protein